MLQRWKLRRFLQLYGDERFARRIAQAIVAARPITDTMRLADIVTAAMPFVTTTCVTYSPSNAHISGVAYGSE